MDTNNGGNDITVGSETFELEVQRKRCRDGDVSSCLQELRQSVASTEAHEHMHDIHIENEHERVAQAGKVKQEGLGLRNYLRIFTFCDRLDAWLYTTGLTASIASGTALPLMAVLFGRFTTNFTNAASGASNLESFRRETDHLVLYFVYLFIGRLLLSYIGNFTVSLAALRTTRIIRKRLLKCTLRQEIWHFDVEKTASIATQVTTNGTRINQGIAEKLASVTQALATFLSAFIVAFTVQWKLTLITICVVPATLMILVVGITINAAQESRMVKIYSESIALAQDTLASIKTVHAFWAQEKIIRQYDRLLAQARVEGNKKSPTSGIVAFLLQFSSLGGTALTFWKGFCLFNHGEITDPGTVLSVVLLVTIGTTGMLQVLPQLGFIVNASSAAAELFQIMAKTSLLDPLAPLGDKPDYCVGDITFKQISFAYPARSSVQVLRELDLSIAAGKTTAIVGASGCGKSTLLGLIERWYVPQAGQILLDGKTLDSYNTKWLRSHIRIVQQEPTMFRGSIFDNVAKGFVDFQRAFPEEEKLRLVQEACKYSNAHSFIESLPDGYDTQVGENASMLSGGQKQRIAIARSIISDPEILLLDEATSALDPCAESIVQDALDKVSRNRTTIVIAHKIATVMHADKIAVLSSGKVVETGTHQELLAKNGRYAALVRAQNLWGMETREDTKGERVGLKRSGEADQFAQQPQPTAQLCPETTKLSGQDEEFGTMNKSLFSCFFILIREQKGLYRLFMFAVPASVIAAGNLPVQAFLFSKLIDVFTLTPQEGQVQADFLALMLLALALVNALTYLILEWVCNLISQTSTYHYRSELFRLLIKQDLHFFDCPENASGALASKLTSVPNALQDMMSISLFLILMLLTTLVASSVLALAYGWKLGLIVVFSGMPVLIGCGYARFRFERQLETKTQGRFAACAALASEVVTSIRTVASLTLEDQICEEYDALLDGIAKTAVGTMTWTILGLAFSQSLEFLLFALGFWYGAQLLADGDYTVTQVFVSFLAVVFGGQAAGQIFGFTVSMSAARSAANYILWARTLNPSIAEDDAYANIKPPKNGILGIEEVEFAHQQRKTSVVLKCINMQITPGSYVAFVGPSGSGKSTLISLIDRMYDPTRGTIGLDGRDIKGISLSLYRGSISLVQQEPVLFQGSLRENISLGLERQASDDEIREACKQANILDFISSLPQGLATPCGSRGLSFSGGQRQRIAIARALIRQPQILLLDEATSALDTLSEKVIEQTLNAASSSRTTIAVAHRLSTIRHARCIFVFEDGKIVEKGTHEELQSIRGRYFEMCLAQSLDDSSLSA